MRFTSTALTDGQSSIIEKLFENAHDDIVVPVPSGLSHAVISTLPMLSTLTNALASTSLGLFTYILSILGATTADVGMVFPIESMYRFSMLFYDDKTNDVGSLSIETDRLYMLKSRLNL